MRKQQIQEDIETMPNGIETRELELRQEEAELLRPEDQELIAQIRAFHPKV